MPSRASTLLFATGLCIAASCGDDAATTPNDPNSPPVTPAGATLTIVVQTTGTNPDPDGYAITLDNGMVSRSLASNGSVTFTALAPGEHQVAISGVARNCRLLVNTLFTDEGWADSRTIEIISRAATLREDFAVTCYDTGTLVIRVTTAGSAAPTLLIGALTHHPQWLLEMPPNGELEIPFVTPRPPSTHRRGMWNAGIERVHAGRGRAEAAGVLLRM